MKSFKTNNLETVTYCCTEFNFDAPSAVLKLIKELMRLLEG